MCVETADELEDLLESMLSYKERGISLLERDKDKEIWQYGQSILFTVTVVTTIGKSTGLAWIIMGGYVIFCYSKKASDHKNT